MFDESERYLRIHGEGDLAPWLVDASRIHEDLFSPEMPITDDDRFIKQFHVPGVPLPDHVLDRHWWRTVGQHLHKRAVDEAKSRHEQRVREIERAQKQRSKEYEALVRSVKKENQLIDAQNEKRQQEYDGQVEEYKRARDLVDDKVKRLACTPIPDWRPYRVIRKHYPGISRLLVWEIHRLALFSTENRKLMAFAAKAAIARLCLTLTLAILPWGRHSYVILAAVIGCQFCYLRCILRIYQRYSFDWTKLFKSEKHSLKLVTRFWQWNKMVDELDLTLFEEWARAWRLIDPKRLGTLVLPENIAHSNYEFNREAFRNQPFIHLLIILLGVLSVIATFVGRLLVRVPVLKRVDCNQVNNWPTFKLLLDPGQLGSQFVRTCIVCSDEESLRNGLSEDRVDRRLLVILLVGFSILVLPFLVPRLGHYLAYIPKAPFLITNLWLLYLVIRKPLEKWARKRIGFSTEEDDVKHVCQSGRLDPVLVTVLGVLSVIPFVSLLLFIAVFLLFITFRRTDYQFLGAIWPYPKNLYLIRDKLRRMEPPKMRLTYPAAPSPVILLPIKPLPKKPPPVSPPLFVAPPLPTRPKGELHV